MTSESQDATTVSSRDVHECLTLEISPERVVAQSTLHWHAQFMYVQRQGHTHSFTEHDDKRLLTKLCVMLVLAGKSSESLSSTRIS